MWLPGRGSGPPTVFSAAGPCSRSLPSHPGLSADSDALAFQVVTCPGVTLQGNRAWGPWWPLPQRGTRRWRSLPGDQASCGPAAWADPGRRARPRRHAEPGTEALPLGDPRLCSEAAAAGRSWHRGPGLRGDRNDAAVRAARGEARGDSRWRPRHTPERLERQAGSPAGAFAVVVGTARAGRPGLACSSDGSRVLTRQGQRSRVLDCASFAACLQTVRDSRREGRGLSLPPESGRWQRLASEEQSAAEATCSIRGLRRVGSPRASCLQPGAAGRTEASRLWRSPGPQEWQQSAPASVTGSGPIRQPLRDVHQTSVQRRLRMAPHRLPPAARRSPRRPWRRCGLDEPATVSSVSVDGSPLLPPFAAAAGARLGSLSRGAGGGLRMRPGTGHRDGRVFSCL